MRSYILEKALFFDGWADNVRIDIADDGTIARVEAGAPSSDAQRFAAIALLGLPNLHCVVQWLLVYAR